MENRYLLIAGIVVGLFITAYCVVHLCTYYRHLGWHDCEKANNIKFYDSSKPYEVPELEQFKDTVK